VAYVVEAEPRTEAARSYVASGHAVLGYTMGPTTGKVISEMITGKPIVSFTGTAEIRPLF